MIWVIFILILLIWHLFAIYLFYQFLFYICGVLFIIVEYRTAAVIFTLSLSTCNGFFVFVVLPVEHSAIFTFNGRVEYRQVSDNCQQCMNNECPRFCNQRPSAERYTNLSYRLPNRFLHIHLLKICVLIDRVTDKQMMLQTRMMKINKTLIL